MSPGAAPGLETQVLQPLHLPASGFLFSPSGPALPSGPKPVRVQNTHPLSPSGQGSAPVLQQVMKRMTGRGKSTTVVSSSTDQASASPLCSAGLLSLQGHLTEVIRPTPAHSGLDQPYHSPLLSTGLLSAVSVTSGQPQSKNIK